MQDVLLLPQWAKSKQEQRAECLKLIAHGIGEFKRVIVEILGDLANAAMSVIERLVQALRPHFGLSKLKRQIRHKPRKPSSRRLKVQAKRKRLGLPVDGKFRAFRHVTDVRCRPTRRESYAAALQADAIICKDDELGELRQDLIKMRLTWFMSASWVKEE